MLVMCRQRWLLQCYQQETLTSLAMRCSSDDENCSEQTVSQKELDAGFWLRSQDQEMYCQVSNWADLKIKVGKPLDNLY